LGPLGGASRTAPSKASVQGRAARVSGPAPQSIGAAVQSSDYASSRCLGRPRTSGRHCDLSPRPPQARSTAGSAPHCLIPSAENAFSAEDAPRESARTVVRKVAAARAHRHPTSPDGAVQAPTDTFWPRVVRARLRVEPAARARRTSTRPRSTSPGLPLSPDAKPHVRCLFAKLAALGTSWSIARPRGRAEVRPLGNCI